MPLYDYNCDACGHEFCEQLRMDDRKIPVQSPCPNCKKSNTVQQSIKAVPFVTSSISTLRRAGSEWGDVLKKVKKASGKGNTIHD